MKNYRFGDGSLDPLYLTNAVCEPTHDYVEQLLTDFGLTACEDHGGFYPLTNDEQNYIGDEVIDVGDGFQALLGYSALYQRQKYLMPSVEIFFGQGGNVSYNEALEYGHALASELEQRVGAVGGHVFVREEGTRDNHVIQVLIPFDYAMSKGRSFEDWKAHLETDLLASDLKLSAKGMDAPSP